MALRGIYKNTGVVDDPVVGAKLHDSFAGSIYYICTLITYFLINDC